MPGAAGALYHGVPTAPPSQRLAHPHPGLSSNTDHPRLKPSENAAPSRHRGLTREPPALGATREPQPADVLRSRAAPSPPLRRTAEAGEAGGMAAVPGCGCRSRGNGSRCGGLSPPRAAQRSAGESPPGSEPHSHPPSPRAGGRGRPGPGGVCSVACSVGMTPPSARRWASHRFLLPPRVPGTAPAAEARLSSERQSVT